MKIRKIRNVSESAVSVVVGAGTTIILAPEQELSDVCVFNLEYIKPFVAVEYDLSEVPTISEGRRVLND
jgi:hypothetical protein